MNLKKFNITPRTIIKGAATFVVGAGTHKIVKGIISSHVSTENPWEKITVAAASLIITGVVTTATKKFTSEAIDEVFDGVAESVGEIKISAKLDRINKQESTFEDEGLEKDEYELDTETNKWKPKPPVEKHYMKVDIDEIKKMFEDSGLDVTMEKMPDGTTKMSTYEK